MASRRMKGFRKMGEQQSAVPRILGVLMALAGGAYLIFLWPALGNRLFVPWIMVPAIVGGTSLTLWLLLLDVKADRSKLQNEKQQTAAGLGMSPEIQEAPNPVATEIWSKFRERRRSLYGKYLSSAETFGIALSCPMHSPSYTDCSGA